MMSGVDSEPRAVVLLVAGGEVVMLGVVSGWERGDLALLDDLLRLNVRVRREGWQVRLADVHPDLRALCELLGIADRFGL